MSCLREMSCAMALVMLCSVLVNVAAVQSSWKPILPSVGGNFDSRFPPAIVAELQRQPPASESRLTDSFSHFEHNPFEFSQAPAGPSGPSGPSGHYQNEEGDQCTLYKVNFNQELYFQYIQYKIGIPDMKEFTMCMWSKFRNHSNDHPLFSYATPNQPRAILSWVSNTDRASYFSMSVEGHTFYRLNYPLRLNRWYHSCQSWNSRTGEWQIWVNAERVGRGFHNRLVGHTIAGNGIAITGQEQRQFGGGFLEGPHAPKASGGLLGEVTMVHLYSAALAPGKAHRDHKHHHGQHHHHATTAVPLPTTPAPPPGFLVGNQLPSALILNLGNLQGQNKLPQPLPPQIPTPSPTLHPLNPQNGINELNRLNPLLGKNPHLARPNPNLFYNQNLNPNLAALNQFNGLNLGNPGYGNAGYGNLPSGLKLTEQNGDVIQQTYHGNSFGQGGFNDAGFNFLGGRGNGQRIFKREEEDAKNVTKRSTDEKEMEKEIEKLAEEDVTDDGKKSKRGIFPGQDFPNGIVSLGGYGGGLSPYQQQTTLLDIDNGQNVLLNAPAALKGGESAGYPREPAEGEVTQIMNICSGCAEEPFKDAEIISWRNTPKKLYSGALYLPAKPQCRRF